MMQNPVAIEDIQAMRRREGIEDPELRQAIHALKAGDRVRLTFLTDAKAFGGETLTVRITSLRGRGFRGKLTSGPAAAALAGLRAGAVIAFTAAHIHSIIKGQPARSRGPAVEPLLKE